MRYEVRSGQLDAIRTSFQSLPNPCELENQFDLLHELYFQDKVTEEANGEASEILPIDKTDSQLNPAENYIIRRLLINQ